MSINLCRVALRGVNGGINAVITPLASVGLGTKLAPNLQRIRQCQQQRRTFIFTPYKVGKMLERCNEKSKIIVVEGTIACGKTKVAKELADSLGMLYMPEATVQYKAEEAMGHKVEDKFVGGVSLEKFYDDPCSKDGHSFCFQYMMYVNRFYQMVDAIKHVMHTSQGVVLERSVFSDFVFTEAMHKIGCFGKDRVKIYEELVFFSLYKLVPPHLVIFLDVPVDRALEGIKKRGNPIEQNISREYLEHLENAYKDKYLPQATENSKVLEYDWTNPLNNVDRIIEDFDLITDAEWKEIKWNKISDDMICNLYNFITNDRKIVNSFLIDAAIPEFEYKAGEYDLLKEEFDEKYRPRPKNFKEVLNVMFSFK